MKVGLIDVVPFVVVVLGLLALTRFDTRQKLIEDAEAPPRQRIKASTSPSDIRKIIYVGSVAYLAGVVAYLYSGMLIVFTAGLVSYISDATVAPYPLVLAPFAIGVYVCYAVSTEYKPEKV